MTTPDFSRYSLVLLQADRIVFCSEKGGLRPLVECIRTFKGRVSGCELQDRVIGLAAAKLVVSSGLIDRIITRTASAGAVAFLKQHAVPLVAGEVVSGILNRDRTGPCPMEKKAESVENPDILFRELSDAFGCDS